MLIMLMAMVIFLSMTGCSDKEADPGVTIDEISTESLEDAETAEGESDADADLDDLVEDAGTLVVGPGAGGKTWNKILFVNNRTGVADMVVDPFNPNKLVVAMWEFRRWPWFFKSGGPGSGLYITYDGGTTWSRKTKEDGLPDGELGRIGLAISQSNPKVIYATIEAEKNGLYRSDDGGFKWVKTAENKDNDDKTIGDRPFYYNDLVRCLMNKLTAIIDNFLIKWILRYSRIPVEPQISPIRMHRFNISIGSGFIIQPQ